MIDVQVLINSEIRHGKARGRIEAVSLPWVRLEWEKGNSVSLLRSDASLEEIEILTMDRGWIPLKAILGTKEESVEKDKIKSLVEEVRGILHLDTRRGDEAAREALYAEAAAAVEAEIFAEADAEPKGKFKKGSAHNPFKTAKKLGPTKIKGVAGRVLTKRGYWSCKCANYRCKCKGSEGERKTVVIGRAYKKKYNALYRKWRGGATKFKKGAWARASKAKSKLAAKK